MASWAALCLGGFFYVIGAVGLNRMPDLFTRMHAVSVSDTLGVGLLTLGMAIHSGASLITVKLLIVVLVLWTTGAVASHALARAALHDGEKPVLVGADGRLTPTDCVTLFPELGPRLAQPLSSEAVETGADQGDPAAATWIPGRSRSGDTNATASAAAEMGMAAMRINMLGALGLMKMFRIGTMSSARSRGRTRDRGSR
ncbi:MAG: monovalent cation/H(+) antiporter subunit G [Paracoccaceae bacterium]|nr:monovalent cation/H(+) antiporter subunit G [Paracoccaceae bacterium]